MKGDIMEIALNQIKADHKFSPREKVDEETVKDYIECLEQLPPIVVFKLPDEDKYILADGWHRFRAAEQLEWESIEADVKYGNKETALEYAFLANLKHGRPLNRKEKRGVIAAFLKWHPERANKWIAADLGTTDVTVGNIRAELEKGSKIKTLDYYVTRNGQEIERGNAKPPKEELTEPEEEQPEPEEETPVIPMLGVYALNQIHQVDCLQGLAGLPENSLDLVVTDPPYNLGKNYGEGSSDSLPTEDYFNWCMQWFIGVYRTLKDGGTFYVMHYPEVTARWKQQLDNLFTFQRWLSWVYPSNIGHSNGNWRRSHRAILYYVKGKQPSYFKGDADPQPYKNPDDHRVAHLGKAGTTPYDWWEFDLVKNVSQPKTEWPNQLPVDLVKRIVTTSCAVDGIICDPFMGSGTTAEAALMTERSWIGFDLQSKACEITRNRIKC
jgi:site-specific DNA-methyltransferase (adenine-specific)